MNRKFKKTDAKKKVLCEEYINNNDNNNKKEKKNLARQSNLCGLSEVGGNTCELYIMHEVAYDLWLTGGGSVLNGLMHALSSRSEGEPVSASNLRINA